VSKKTAIIFFILASIFFSFTLLGRAQKDAEFETDVADLVNQFTAEVSKLEAKMDKLSVTQDNTAKEISMKLEQVLSNQENILKELAIVKVRASRPH
jgi:outer membrane murein-binding lipoprotein Lpp